MNRLLGTLKSRSLSVNGVGGRVEKNAGLNLSVSVSSDN